MELWEYDLNATISNREKLEKNRNLIFWYSELYSEMVSCLPKDAEILEIGSGSSPFKKFNEKLITSDVLKVPFADIVFDAHKIHELSEIEDGSLDAVILTNVIHHLKDPILFLKNAAVKLKKNGQIIFAEPYFSLISDLIYRFLHKEPVHKDITEPMLENVEGPLSSANIYLPFKIFYRNSSWKKSVTQFYEIKKLYPYTSLSYFMTGGMTSRIRIPFYGILHILDLLISQVFPRLSASFFICILEKKSE